MTRERTCRIITWASLGALLLLGMTGAWATPRAHPLAWFASFAVLIILWNAIARFAHEREQRQRREEKEQQP